MESLKEKQRAMDHRWAILGVISLGVTTIVLSSSMINIALPTIQREFQATMSDLQWIVNAYMLLFAGLMLFMGALADRAGHKLMFSLGLLLFIGANTGAAFANSAGGLIAWRCLMGAAAAMLLPTTLAIVRTVFPDEERGKAIGVWAGLNSLGIALGPIIGGALVDGLSWKAIFFVNVPVGAIAIAAGLVLLPRGRNDSRAPLDYLGTVLATVSITAVVLGLIRGGGVGWGDWLVVTTLAGGVVGFVLFVWWESRTDYPVLDLSFFRDRRFASGVTSVFLMSLALVGITFTLTLLMQFVRNYSALQTGVRLLPLAGGIFVGAGSSDNLVKRIGRRAVTSSGFFGTAIVAIAIAFVSQNVSYWVLGLAYFALGFFLGYIAAPATDAIMAAAPEDQAGVVSSTNTVARTMAGAMGVALLGAILSSIYTASFQSGSALLEGVPAALVGPASESVGAAVVIAESLPEAVAQPLVRLAHESFMDGWKVLALISAGLSVVGASLALVLTPRGHAYNRSPSRATHSRSEAHSA